MTRKEIINDLQIIIEYFEDVSGAAPVAMIEAIKIIEKLNQEENDKE